MEPENEGLVRALREGLAGLAQAAMARLGVPERMVMALRFYEGMTNTDVADILGYSEPDVKTRFSNAKRTLNRELKQLGVSKALFPAAMGAFGLMTLSPVGEDRHRNSPRADGGKPSGTGERPAKGGVRRRLGAQAKPPRNGKPSSR
jgi:hypothetical protein